MGWATAHHLLMREPDLDVVVVEKDPSLRHASTTLCDGNVRVQFNLEENIAMSMYAMQVVDNMEDELGFDSYRPDPMARHQGNLFLVNRDSQPAAKAGLELQQRLGAGTEWIDADDIAQRFPALTSTEIVGGTFGPRDGSVDPNVVVDAYRRNAQRNGAELVVGEVESLLVDQDLSQGVLMKSGESIHGSNVVVCAGAWSAQLLATTGLEIPVEPVTRTVYVVSGEVEGSEGMPSTFLPSGVYVLPESDGTFLIAWSTEADPIGFDFAPAPRSRFYDVIWPALVDVLPSFDRLEVVSSWAGLYAQNHLDANGIIGAWPEIEGLYLATGFSGHGFQQAPAVGRYLAERILGVEHSLDLARLGPERILTGVPVAEFAGRII